MLSKARAAAACAAELAQLSARQSSHVLRTAHTGTDVVLQQVVQKLGEAGQRISVSRGFARNHLVPSKLAKLVPKEVARRPPRSQGGGGSAAAAGPLTSTSQLQLTSVLDILCSSPLEVVRKPASGTLSSTAQLATPVTAACISKEVMRQRGVSLVPQLLAMDAPLVTMGQHQVPLRLAAPSGERINLSVAVLNARQPVGERRLAAAVAMPSVSAD